MVWWNSCREGLFCLLFFVLRINSGLSLFFYYFLLSFAKFCHSLDRHFSPDEVLQLLDRFYNLEVLVTTCSIIHFHVHQLILYSVEYEVLHWLLPWTFEYLYKLINIRVVMWPKKWLCSGWLVPSSIICFYSLWLDTDGLKSSVAHMAIMDGTRKNLGQMIYFGFKKWINSCVVDS